MLSYCLKCKKYTKNNSPNVMRTKNNRLVMLSRCPVCHNRKFRFIKEQTTKGLLGNLGINTPLNEIINKFLLAGDKFMPEMHLRRPDFVYSACGLFTKHKERIKKFKQTGDTRYIYRNELDKACFQHDSAYADSKNLVSRTQADKVLRDKTYNIASNPSYDGYQRGLASMVYNFLDKKSAGGNLELATELHKLIIRKFNKRKVYSSY